MHLTRVMQNLEIGFEKHMKKSERSCVEMGSKFYENSFKMIAKLRQNGAQSGPRGSRGSKNYAEITKTRPEALGAGTLAAF